MAISQDQKNREAGKPRPIYSIAADIRKHWRRKDGTPSVYFGAVPYLNAMGALDSIDDTYGYDDARSIVLYFLANASGFRGEDARRLKAELKELTK